MLIDGRRDPGPPRHFLDIDQHDTGELRSMLDLGFAYKNGRRDRPLEGKTLAMIFEKPSTRTRVSFEVAMRQLGGDVIVLDTGHQPARPRRDDCRHGARPVALRRCDHDPHQPRRETRRIGAVCDRAGDQRPDRLVAPMPDHGRCDDLQERKGPVADTVVAWSGDGNNVAVSWIHAAVRFGFDLRLACRRNCRCRRRWRIGRAARAAVSR